MKAPDGKGIKNTRKRARTMALLISHSHKGFGNGRKGIDNTMKGVGRIATGDDITRRNYLLS
jgi:hypothetical protein